MVQEFHVVRCFSCQTFQVQQVKKAVRWSCKMCGEKQSLLKEFGRGSAADCRHHVQKLNAMRGAMMEEQEHNTLSLGKQVEADGEEETEEQRDIKVTHSRVSCWSKYLDTSEETGSEEEEEGNVLMKSQQLHGNDMIDRKRKRRDGQTPKQSNWSSLMNPGPANTKPTSLMNLGPANTKPTSLMNLGPSSTKLTSLMNLGPANTKPTSLMNRGPSSTKPTSLMNLGPSSTKPTSLMNLGPANTKPTSLMNRGPSSTKPTSLMNLGPSSTKPTSLMNLGPANTKPTSVMNPGPSNTKPTSLMNPGPANTKPTSLMNPGPSSTKPTSLMNRGPSSTKPTSLMNLGPSNAKRTSLMRSEPATTTPSSLSDTTAPSAHTGPVSRWACFLSSDHQVTDDRSLQSVDGVNQQLHLPIRSPTRPHPLLPVSSMFQSSEEFSFDDFLN